MASKHPIILREIRTKTSSQRTATQVSKALSEGLLAIIPTDTVYGLAADPRCPEWHSRLCVAKGRPTNKPVAYLASSLEQIEDFGGKLNTLASKLSNRFWPGPLTMVLETDQGFRAFRVPDHPLTVMILEQCRHPLAVTSANRSGEPAPKTCDEAVSALGAYVGIAVDAGPAPVGQPSTVIRTKGEQIEVLREGSISEAKLRKAAEA